mmetsp:Transcript_3579/g.8429  ORF Transcript_3579/g.8429 Transcript_3579/m.8429 type:complete len:213 (+) Transcript_3579:877-1515(+)
MYPRLPNGYPNLRMLDRNSSMFNFPFPHNPRVPYRPVWSESRASKRPTQLPNRDTAKVRKRPKVRAARTSSSSSVATPLPSASSADHKNRRLRLKPMALHALNNSVFVTYILPSTSSRRRQARTRCPYCLRRACRNCSRVRSATTFLLDVTSRRSLSLMVTSSSTPANLIRCGNADGSIQASSSLPMCPRLCMSKAWKTPVRSCTLPSLTKP